MSDDTPLDAAKLWELIRSGAVKVVPVAAETEAPLTLKVTLSPDGKRAIFAAARPGMTIRMVADNIKYPNIASVATYLRKLAEGMLASKEASTPLQRPRGSSSSKKKKRGSARAPSRR